MKNLKFALLTLLFPLSAFAAGTNVIEEARKIEAEMDRTKGEFTNPATAEKVAAISYKAAKFVHDALSAPRLDDISLLAIARVMVRSFAYDNEGEMAACNVEQIERHADGLERAIKKLEAGAPKITPQMVVGFRTYVSLSAKTGDKDPGCFERKPNAVEKLPLPKAKPSKSSDAASILIRTKKKQAATESSDDGAGIPKCLEGCPQGRPEQTPVGATALKHLAPVGEMDFSSWDPTPDNGAKK
ncbi:MAG: hypothetical protein KF799_12130 [Bdellovibrionales bacterium]|nr:hypothetical protein [Bdellovibrionales bacterium]